MNMKEYAFGIDLGGTTAKVGLFTTAGALLEKWEVPTDTSNAGEHILGNLAKAVKDKMQENGITAEQVEGVGVGVPGPVLDSRIVPIVCANLGGWGERNVSIQLSGLLDGIGSLFTGASLGATLVGQCPAILIAVGLWLIYLAEAGKISTATKNTGFTLVKISTIISLAVSILGLVVAEILAIMITATAAKYDDSAIGGGIIIMLLLLVVMGLGILMNSKTLSTLGVMAKTAQTAQPSDKISTYVAVISFLNGLGAVIGMLVVGTAFPAMAAADSDTAKFVRGTTINAVDVSKQTAQQAKGYLEEKSLNFFQKNTE